MFATHTFAIAKNTRFLILFDLNLRFSRQAQPGSGIVDWKNHAMAYGEK